MEVRLLSSALMAQKKLTVEVDKIQIVDLRPHGKPAQALDEYDLLVVPSQKRSPFRALVLQMGESNGLNDALDSARNAEAEGKYGKLFLEQARIVRVDYKKAVRFGVISRMTVL